MVFPLTVSLCQVRAAAANGKPYFLSVILKGRIIFLIKISPVGGYG